MDTDTVETEVEPTIAPEDIDTDFAPRVRDDVVSIAVGDDTVLLGQFGRAHVLNPTGALVWQFLDGEATLGELIADFTEVLGAEPAEVRDDVVEFARALGRIGLLEGVARRIGDLIQINWESPEALAVGDVLEPFTLPDLSGTEISSETWRGHRVLLVNWSPGCGFCVKIANELARAETGLTEHGIDLVFVTSGDVDDNRRVLDDAGLHAPALLKRDDIDPFAGFGTPAAYLLDADGRVAEPMALGADQVPRLAAELSGVELDEHEDQPPGDDVAEALDDARYLPAPSAVCGPGGGAGATSTKWAGTRAYRVGEFHVGVRYNTADTAEVLDALFAGAHVRDRRAPDNYSVALYPGSNGSSRKLNLLVHGTTQLVRSRSAGRALAALLTYLSVDTAPPDADDGLVRVQASAAVRDGEALLLPRSLVSWIKELQPRLARRGLVLADVPYATIDLGSRDLVVAEPSIPYDASVLAEVDNGVRLGAELPYVRPGRYPITDWYVTRAADEVGPLSAAVGVASAYPLVFAGEDEPARVGKALAELFAHVRAHGVWLDRPEALTDQLDAD